MKRVYKYELHLGAEECSFPFGSDAAVVHVGMQEGTLCLWALVDPAKLNTGDYRHFTVRGTGHGVSPGLVHCGTAIAAPIVWHVFEVIEVGESAEVATDGRPS
ncbi:MAG: hypothetical protein AAFP86_21235 [Planctomycetota bacterium]